ncbi:AAA family ATPase [Microvirga massiliensis]|uniref:AAA family ATPase n=1 Tax=Microvirga massiliensis TaxID=1033741 RepID=UPI00062B6072
MRALEARRVPRIIIEAFYESPAVAQAIEAAAGDRAMARASLSLHPGGIPAATEHFRQSNTPSLIIVESRAEGASLLHELDGLAAVCDDRTKVLVLGSTNDISLYREVIKRGVSEYMLTPFDPLSLIATIAGIFSDASSAKLGRVYAFIGAKGGVGSSTIAHNTGWTIASSFGVDVLLADMDLPFGTGSLDFNQDTNQGIAEAIHDAGRLDEMLLDRLVTKCDNHFSLLAAPVALDRDYDLAETAFEPLLDVAQASFPFVILDIPHLWSGWAKRALASADEVVITAAPDLANLRNAKNIVAFLKQTRPNDPPPKLILNQVGLPKRPEIKPREFVGAIQIEPLATLPFESLVFGKAANNGQMIAQVAPKHPVAASFAEVARIISGRNSVKPRRGLSLPSLFKRRRDKR